MTTTALFVIFILAPAAVGLLLVGIRVGRRIRHTRATRQAPTEPAHRHPATTKRHLLLRALRHLVHHRAPVPVPVWCGATPGWSPAAAVACVDTDPNLITLPMHMRADHAALTPISDALDEFDGAVSAALERFLHDDPQTLLRLPSSVQDTGALDVAALRELLAADVAVTA